MRKLAGAHFAKRTPNVVLTVHHGFVLYVYFYYNREYLNNN